MSAMWPMGLLFKMLVFFHFNRLFLYHTERIKNINIKIILLLFNFKLCQYLLNSQLYLLQMTNHYVDMQVVVGENGGWEILYFRSPASIQSTFNASLG